MQQNIKKWNEKPEECGKFTKYNKKKSKTGKNRTRLIKLIKKMKPENCGKLRKIAKVLKKQIKNRNTAKNGA